MLNELAGLGISSDILQRAVRVATTRLEAPVNAVRDALVTAPVAHADETNLRVNGTLHRLPVLSTDRLTAYFPQPKRGAEALDGFGLLTLFAGVLVHDPWSAYERYQSLHAFCHAHHLRERSASAERSPSQPWATDSGRVKQAPAYNLIRWLREHRNKVLPALPHRPARPFDNNQAERDLRVPKLKQKVSGCCRSDTGTEDFAILRS